MFFKKGCFTRLETDTNSWTVSNGVPLENLELFLEMSMLSKALPVVKAAAFAVEPAEAEWLNWLNWLGVPVAAAVGYSGATDGFAIEGSAVAPP